MAWQNFSDRFAPKDNVNKEAQSAIKKASLVSNISDSRARKTDQFSVSTPKRVDVIDTSDNSFSGGNDYEGGHGLEFHAMFEQFKNLTQFQLDTSKEQRLCNYREIVNGESVIESCLHEIVISCISSETLETPLSGELKGDYEDGVKDTINKEIKEIISHFNMDECGEKIFENYLTTGEFVSENVFSYQKPHLGIIDVKTIKPEHIEPIYRNFENDEIEFFICKKRKQISARDLTTQSQKQSSTVHNYDSVPMALGQVTYCNSGKWDSTERFVIPYIYQSFQAGRYYNWLRQAVVIDAMNNAPERKLWKVPTSNQSTAQARISLNNFAQKLKRKFGFGETTGEVTMDYNPMSIGENIIVGVDSDGNSVTFDNIAGSTAFQNGFNGILTHVQNEIYESMKVPISRLNPDNTQSDGTTITSQDLAFSRRIESIQKRIACAIKRTVIVHLKLKGLNIHLESCKRAIDPEYDNPEKHPNGYNFDDRSIMSKHLDLIEEDYYEMNLKPTLLEEGNYDDESHGDKIKRTIGESYWNQFDLKESDIHLEFELPTSFRALRQQQMEEIKWNTFNNKLSSGNFSYTMAMKDDLGWDDSKVKANNSWLRIEAEKEWEKAKIIEHGPNFRAKLAEELGVGGEGEDSGGDGGLSDFGGGGSPSPSGGSPSIGGGSSSSGGDSAQDFGGGEGLDDLDSTDAPDTEAPSDDADSPEQPDPETSEPDEVDIGDSELFDDEQ